VRLLVTGGAGFIGSNFVRLVLEERPDWTVTNLDKLTYAGNLKNLRDVENNPGYSFVRGDICDPTVVSEAMADADAVVNFAAETHVDRSIHDPTGFIETDVTGVYVLCEEARRQGLTTFVHVSTDEVYGSIEDGAFSETDPLSPSNPYSASKAGGEMLAMSYFKTFELPVVVSRGSNTFGPFQYPEKFMPLFITNAIDDEPLPLYGDGLNVRDWLFVEDHCRALLFLVENGVPGELYNVGGGNERTNIDVARAIVARLGKSNDLIKPVKDRPGHDRRYALDCAKLEQAGCQPLVSFDDGFARTVDWYLANEWWWRELKTGEYLEYYKRNYENR